MRYRVVRYFRDLQDNNHAYNTGDTFPREGVNVSEDRIKELASTQNKQFCKLIEAVAEEPTEVKHTEETLEKLTTREIKTLAAERGYKITKNAKYDVIAQFLNQQR